MNFRLQDLFGKILNRRSLRFPSKNQWRGVFGVLTKKEKIILSTFFILFLSSGLFLSFSFYFKNTKIVPARGGEYKEGVVGYPRLINPIYADNSDVDRDLTELIFSGLMKYDKNGNIVPDLAKDYKIDEEGRIFEFFLKEDIFWHDGEKLTADDIVFTIQTIQNPASRSPLRTNWLGVKVEKISDNAVRFKLQNSYSAFLERATVKILPKHIWAKIPSQDLPLSVYNLKPVGSGPYRLKGLKQNRVGSVTSLELVTFPRYFGKLPYLSKISFRFFDSEEKLIEAAKRKEIDAFSLNLPSAAKEQEKNFRLYSFVLPRYFALFFNLNSGSLKKRTVRQALNYLTDKEEIVREALDGKGKIVDSPVLAELYNYQSPLFVYEFNPEKAEKLLQSAGFEKKSDGEQKGWVKTAAGSEFKNDLKEGSRGAEVTLLQKCLAQDPEVYPEAKITGYFGPTTKKAVIAFQEKYAAEILRPWGFSKGTGLVGKSTRAKLNEICGGSTSSFLKFSLTTVKDPVLEKVAELLKKQWQEFGIGLEIETYSVNQLKNDIIKPRKYEMLLFGEILGQIPDPYPFWHSSQKKDPGLNLSGYENKRADRLLNEARTIIDPEARAKKYQEFQNILIEDAPAIFLYSPDYLYFSSPKIKGIESGLITDPSKRFAGIENWYIKTKRSWK
jgi:ABC-type transport system substrate-binding protein